MGIMFEYVLIREYRLQILKAAVVVLVLHASHSVSTLALGNALAIRSEEAHTVNFGIDIKHLVALGMPQNVVVICRVGLMD